MSTIGNQFSLARAAGWARLVWLALAMACAASPQASAQVGTNCADPGAPLLLGPDGGTMPDAAIDNLGRTHVVWRGNDLHVWYAQVGPDGVILLPARKVYDFVSTTFPRIAVDANGDAHIVTTTTSSPATLIYFKVSNGTRVLIKGFTMFTPGAFDREADYWPSIDINPLTGLPVIAAEVQASWSEYIGGFPVELYNDEISVISLDATGTPIRPSRWSAYYSRNNSGPVYWAEFPEVAVDSEGTAHCVWVYSDPVKPGNSVGYARGGAGAWGEIADNRNVAGSPGWPRIVRGEPGFLEVVWSTTAGAVVRRELANSGSTVVDDTVVSQAAAQASRPRIACGNGNAYFGWADAREGNGMQIYARDLVAASPERNVTCSPVSVFNHALAARADDTFDVAWQDNRTGTNLIYYRSISIQKSITLLRVTKDEANVRASDDLDSPIVPVTDTNALAGARPLGLGVVADGVTPVLFKIAALPGNYSLALSNDATAYTFSDHLYVLQAGRDWMNTTDITIAPPADGSATGTAFAYLQGVDWYDFAGLSIPNNEVNMTLTLTSTTNSTITNSANFKMRPPPVVLVHGFHADSSTWSSGFLNVLQAARPADFIIPLNYGVPPMTPDNTTGRFDELAPELDNVLMTAVEGPNSGPRAHWAFTRYDIVGHSQGGVLARMLCTQDPHFTFGAEPFVGEANLYRGRFRRIITIGSPHNGSLLLYYIRQLQSNPSIYFPDPFLLGPLLQPKFDPFGQQTAEINDPHYAIHARAKFQLIRCTIDGGDPPNVLSIPPILHLAGLCDPVVLLDPSPHLTTRGAVVLPRGSDGVVDYDSEGAGISGDSPLISELGNDNIVHADSWPLLFGVWFGHSETTWSPVATEVVKLLDGPTIWFDPFPLPPALSADLKKTIDSVMPGVLSFINLILPVVAPGAKDSTLNFQLVPPASWPVQGQIAWFAGAFTTNGVSGDGITLTIDTNNAAAVTVTLDDGVVGDVVLYATYSSTNNMLIVAQPTVVWSRPAGTVMNGIQLVPASATLSLGDTLTPAIWATYTNGLQSRIYIPMGQVSYTSSDTNIALVNASGTITLNCFGSATIGASYNGFTAQLVISSVVPAVKNLAGHLATNGMFQLSFMGTYGMTNVIQASTNLIDWIPLATLQNTNGFIEYTDNDSTRLQRRFYRVLIP